MKFKIAEKLPGNNGNAYSSSKYLYNKIKVTEDKIIASNKNELTEAIDWQVDDNEKGGMIILSTDINAIPQSENAIVDWILKKVKTLKNRLSSTKKVDKIAQKNDLVGWTIGHFLNGRYTAKNGVPFGENSLSVELVGIPSETLIQVATDLCNEFEQETVLVKDYTTGNILFVNGN